jgi:fatty acid synthase subunit beta
LAPTTQPILDDLEGITITPAEVAFPVFATDSGKNLQEEAEGTNLVPLLVHMITHQKVHWEKATMFTGATHIIDFGPGGLSGLGSLTHRNKDGTGVRIIIAGSLEGGGGIGGQGEIFERGEGGVRYNVDWVKSYRPQLVKVWIPVGWVLIGRRKIEFTFRRDSPD